MKLENKCQNIGAIRILDAIKLLPTKYIIPKTSFTDEIVATFK